MANDDDDRRDAPPLNGDLTEGSPNVGQNERGQFVAGNTLSRGRPSSSKEFRQLARDFSPTALKKLYQIALTGTGQAAVRACEIIIERAWGKTPLEVSGPKGAPLDARFYGAARSAIEEAIAKAATAEAAAKVETGDPKN